MISFTIREAMVFSDSDSNFRFLKKLRHSSTGNNTIVGDRKPPDFYILSIAAQTGSVAIGAGGLSSETGDKHPVLNLIIMRFQMLEKAVDSFKIFISPSKVFEFLSALSPEGLCEWENRTYVHYL